MSKLIEMWIYGCVIIIIFSVFTSCDPRVLSNSPNTNFTSPAVNFTDSEQYGLSRPSPVYDNASGHLLKIDELKKIGLGIKGLSSTSVDGDSIQTVINTQEDVSTPLTSVQNELAPVSTSLNVRKKRFLKSVKSNKGEKRILDQTFIQVTGVSPTPTTNIVDQTTTLPGLPTRLSSALPLQNESTGRRLGTDEFYTPGPETAGLDFNFFSNVTKNPRLTTERGDSVSPSGSESPLSCQGRCGDRKSFPCSCTDICIVNGNCCQDMREQCFSMYQSAGLLLKHLKDAKVECSSHTDTFVITSCPSQYADPEDKISNTLLLSEAQIDEKTSLPENEFLSVVLNVPVTDMTTGLVYRNRSISRCNGVLDSNASLWAVQVAVKSLESDLDDLQKLNEVVASDIFSYSPSSTLDTTSKGSECIPVAIRECREEWLADHPSWESLCVNGPIIYYTSRRQFFKNYNCLLCNLGPNSSSTYTKNFYAGDKSFKLSLVASLTSSGVLKVQAASGKDKLSWDTMECLVNAEGGDRNICSKPTCGQQFEERPDGKCRTLQILRIAVSGEDSCTFMETDDTKKKLQSIIKCYFETFYSVEFVSETIRFDTVFDNRLNRSLLRMSANMYTQDLYYPSATRKVIARELLMLVYQANLCCDPNPASYSCNNEVCRQEELEVPVVNTMDLHNFNNADYLEEIANLQTVSNRSTIFCSLLQRDNASFTMHCIKEPIFESNLDFLTRAAEVSCFNRNFRKTAILEMESSMCNGNNRNVFKLEWFVLLFAVTKSVRLT